MTLVIDPHNIDTRNGLPDALKVLLREYPRDIWTSHKNFDGLTQFWLSRHLEFRRALQIMQSDAQAVLDKTADRETNTHRLVQVGNFFTEALHGHHHIEDHHYFPLFINTERRLATGFEILDSDHHALDGHLNDMEERLKTFARTMADTDDPNKVMGNHLEQLDEFGAFLDRHLTDEEELIVPSQAHTGLGGGA